MRRITILLVLTLCALPLAAQNVDIESLSGLQFNFGNPGARSLGMGGAFLGLADDASAAEANPAGLTILRKTEVSLEVRNYSETQLFSTSGLFPDIRQTEFTHHSDAAVITFGSVVYPIRNKFTVGLYFHEPLHNQGGGYVFPTYNDLTGRQETTVPYYYFAPKGNRPLTEKECFAAPACLRYDVTPYISAVDVRQRTFGLAGAWQVHPKLSIGATARYQTFQEGAFSYRFDPDNGFAPTTVAVQATGSLDGNGELQIEEESDLTVTAGFKWTLNDRISFGGVYKQGPKFRVPLFFAGEETGGEFQEGPDTSFHIPDVAGIGVSIRPIPTLTINADAVRVTYSNLADDFVATIGTVAAAGAPFGIDDVTELRVGAEYFLTTKIPLAIRAGYWRDPAHSLEWRGTLEDPDFVAEALLFPKGQDQNHFSIGAGLAWPRFQVDLAYDTSDLYKAGSISFVTRF